MTAGDRRWHGPETGIRGRSHHGKGLPVEGTDGDRVGP